MLFRIVVAPLLTLFVILSVVAGAYAQGGSGDLPGTKPAPAPNPKGGARTTAKPSAAPTATTVTYNQALKGRLDPRGSEKLPNGQLFEEYAMTAKSDDLLSFELQSDNPGLAVQIFDKEKIEVAVAKDNATGNYRLSTQTGGLPADGDYRVRVFGTVSGRTPANFELTVNRIGLLPQVYNERFQQIMLNFREADQASVDETLVKLEQLAAQDTSKPGTFEFLGIIYLYNRKDLAKAEEAMEKAIAANGAAVVKISYDSQWRRMARGRSGKFDWEDPRTGWLRIRPGQLVLTDTANRTLATLSGANIRELSKIVTATNNLVTITADGVRRQLIFLPGSHEQAEADLVIKLIQNHVMKKSN